MSTSGRDDDAGSEEVEEESADAKIERLATEIEELKASRVLELSVEWFQIKTDIKNRDIERLLLIEKKRCDSVVKEYFEENPHVLEAVPECPICLEKIWDAAVSIRYACCGKLICKKCKLQGGNAFYTCPLCRGEAPESNEDWDSLTKEKADSGIVWAQAAMGRKYLVGLDGVPKDVDKALSLLHEAAEKGSARAKTALGEYYYQIANYEEARRWHEAAAAEGEIVALGQLGLMMKNGLAFDQNEQTRAEAFRLFTISATLFHYSFNPPAMELSRFFLDSPPVMLHYLRPFVEEGNTSKGVMENYAVGLVKMTIEYYSPYGDNIVWAPGLVPGFSPVPEAMFWYRRSDARARSPDDVDCPFARMEQKIRERCANCTIPLDRERKMCCVECKAMYYCGRDCQAAHWKAGHKKDCVKKLKKKLKAAGTLVEL